MAEAIIIRSDDEVEFQNRANSIPFDIPDDKATYFAKRTKRDNVVGPWKPCKLLSRVENTGNNTDRVVQFSDGTKKDVASYELANGKIPMPRELDRGTRVIAGRRSEEMPYKLDESDERIELYSGGSKELYPGIVGNWDEAGRYLVFFDDGMVQYVTRKHIRRVLGNDEYNHAHWNAKKYFEFLMNKTQWELDQTQLKLTEEDSSLKVELNGAFVEAKVKEINGSLALINFEQARRYEWIYLGSPRISSIYRKHIIKKSFDSEIEFKTYQTCLSANDDIAVIDLLEPDDELEQSSRQKRPTINIKSDFNVNGQQAVKHTCGPECLRFDGRKKESDVNIESYTALQRPMMVGWKRLGEKMKQHYITPCGMKLRWYNGIHKYLANTNSKLRIDCFEFSREIEIPTTSTEITKVNDISRGVEKIPIAVRGQRISLDFTYITDYNFDYIDVEPKNNLGRNGCNCTDNCLDKQKCSCWQLTIQIALQRTLKEREYKRHEEIGYKKMKLPEAVPNGIVECSSSCKCCADKCANHVVQNGIQHKLEVFMTESNKGWGVRATTDLPQGAFVCHYAGDVLEETAADLRDSKYQFKLPKATASSNEDVEIIFDSSHESESDDEPEAKISRNDDVLQPFLNYLPPMQNGNADHFPDPDYIESNEELKIFVVDGLKNGNIARFINHSCEPNLFLQKVFASNDKRFPLIAFFAEKLIKANEEITIDYGYEQNDEKQVACRCGATKCRKRLI